jgi:hypothetical protein
MAERSRDNERAESTKRAKRRSRRAIAILVITAALCLSFWTAREYLSADKRLAAIDAARAIPEAENAAAIYNQLLEDYNESEFTAAFLDPAEDDVVRGSPWSSQDHPELARWLEEHQDIIARLLQASKVRKCWFPIPDFPEDMGMIVDRTKAMRKLAHLLVRSANNDIGEGRIEQGLEKYICIIRMGRHSRQQPVAVDFLVGTAVEVLGLQEIRLLIMHDDVTEAHLQVIETALPQANEDWNQEWENMLKVEKLYGRKMPKTGSLLKRLKDWWRGWRNEKAVINHMHGRYLRLLADRRGSHILIALRRFKDKTRHWPESLDAIKPFVPEGTLTDPLSDGPFVYRLTDDGFTLYSTGQNNIDEAGQYRGGADDWPIWPPPTRINKQENTNGK